MLPIGDESVGRTRRPIVNYSLIAICIMVFGAQGLITDAPDALIRTWGLVPARVLQNSGLETYTLITHMFLHGNIMHIGGNMLFLWVFGDNIEDEFGHVPYLVFYLGAGILAGLASVALRATSDVPGIGASGAISGVLGAYLVLFPLNEIRIVIVHPLTMLLWLGSLFVQDRPELPKVVVPALYVLIFYLIYNCFGALMGYVSPSKVDSVAHLGGFLAGYLTIIILRHLFGLWPDSRDSDLTVLSTTSVADQRADARRLQVSGKWAEAREKLEAALQTSDLKGDVRNHVATQLQLAAVLAHLGELGIATECVTAARTLAARNEYSDLLAETDLVAAKVAVQSNDTSSGLELLHSALARARAETIHTIPASRTILGAADVFQKLGDIRKEIALRREAVREFIKAHDRRSAIDALVEIGERLASVGDEAGCREARQEALRMAKRIYYLDATACLSRQLEE